MCQGLKGWGLATVDAVVCVFVCHGSPRCTAQWLLYKWFASLHCPHMGWALSGVFGVWVAGGGGGEGGKGAREGRGGLAWYHRRGPRSHPPDHTPLKSPPLPPFPPPPVVLTTTRYYSRMSSYVVRSWGISS